MGRYSPIALGIALALGAGVAMTIEAAPPPTQAASPAIPAMPLKQALNELAQRAHLQFVYVSKVAEGVRTQGAPASSSQRATLMALLRGTGLRFRYLNANTVTIFPSDKPEASDPPQSTPTPPPSSKPKPQKPKTLKAIIVTGSLIPQSQVETAVPIITLHPEELQKQGFGSLYAALRAQPLATGAVSDNQSTFGATPGALTISLLGLTPSFTLFLINGHPMTSYPLLYGRVSNIVDIGNIPLGMIDHIDIVPGNLSSIYGSSAIAGVVNVVLKRHVNGYELNVRMGGYTLGGGQNERVQFVGGYDKNKLSMIYGVQLNHQNPIWGYQRNISSPSQPGPDSSLGFGNDFTYMYTYYTPNFYEAFQNPGDACNALSGLFGGTTKRYGLPNLGPPLDPKTGQPTGMGYYCGSNEVYSGVTLLNKVKSGNGYLNVKYQISGTAELYASVLYGVSDNQEDFGALPWESNLAGGGIYWNAALGRFEQLYHLFSPEETGGAWNSGGQKYLERTYNAWAGLRGDLGEVHYDVYYARSQQTLDEANHWLLRDKVNAFFQKNVLGPLLGTTSGYPIYDPNIANFYKPITPAQYASMNGIQRDHNQTWIQSANIHVSDDSLFSLPGGDAGFAAVFQYGEQMWSNPTDPRVVAGDFYELTGSQGGGARNFWATGGEFRAPFFKWLTADLSARYDQYSNHNGGTDGRATYRLGVEVRPFQTLLLRANYSTAFRAPDMAYVFAGNSGRFAGAATDYYRCDLYGGPLIDCPYFDSQAFFELHHGNRDLKSVTAKSYSAGFVWSPTDAFDIKADYYNISIANEVELQSVDDLLRTEAACRTGQLNIDSQTCVAAISRVERNPATSLNPNALKQLTVLPINIASERVSGIVASLDYSLGLGRFGDLKFRADYNVTLKHTFQESPDEQTIDLLREPQLPPFSTEFKNIGSASLTWDIGKWSTTLHVTRYGKTPNYAASYYGYGTDVPGFNGQAAGSVPPWILYNGSVTYQVNKQLRLSAIVNNIQNSGPPLDRSYIGWPYYTSGDYNPYGREVWVDLDWRFGQH